MEEKTMSVPDPTTLGLLATAVTGMSGAITVMWRQTMKHLSVTEARLEEAERKADVCNDDRLEIWKALANINKKKSSED
tara:strand:- start:9433 stop:9669 length:237 start_codon:yes stop_codon:yes gene_type:complete